jgi:hypothetical protein
MTLRVWGEYFDTGENTTTAKYQPFQVPTNCLLKAVKPSIILIGSPTITAMTAKLYSNNPATDEPDTLIATSYTSQATADMTTLDHAWKQVWFEFSPEVALTAATTYHLVLNWADAYTFTDAIHVAWAKDFPQKINPTGGTIIPVNLSTTPFAVEFFTAEFY